MRKLRCFQVPGVSVVEVLDEFNERSEDLGVQGEDDIISISVGPPVPDIPVVGPGGTVKPNVGVTIFYWAEQ